VESACANACPHHAVGNPSPSRSIKKGKVLNTYVLVASLSLALVIAVMALVREARLRRALQKLLQRLILIWRSYGQENDPARCDSDTGDHRM
jgi:hypothetical protein